MGRLSGWKYRKSHEILGSTAGAVTNYQIRIKVHYGSGTDGGEDVYLNGKCRTDFGDIRFTADDGETELPYWMEEKVDGDYAIFWVKIPYIPAYPDTTTIYIYYGNPSATTTSNGDNTFLLFDDFDKGYLDTDKWAEFDSGGAYEFVDSCIRLKPVLNANNGVALRSLAQFTNNIEIQAKIIAETDTYYDLGLVKTENIITNKWHGHEADNIGYWLEAQHRTNTENEYLLFRRDVGSAVGIMFSGYKSPIKYELKYVLRYLNNGNIRGLGILPDGTVWFNIYGTDTTYLTDDKYVVIWQGAYSGGWGGYSKWDWVFVRKYIDPEPSHGAWGSEEVCVSLTDTCKGGDWVSLDRYLKLTDCTIVIDYTRKQLRLKTIDIVKSVDKRKVNPLKAVSELAILRDWLVKGFIISLFERVYGEHWGVGYRGKILRDTVKAVEVLSKTSILHREYFDAFMGSDRAFREFIKPVSDLLRTSDRFYKSILKVFEAESSIVGVPFKEMAREARDTVKALEILFTKDIVWDFIEKVIAKERPRKEVLAYFFDTLSTEYVMGKGIPRVVREAVKGVDIASKELATSFQDLFKVKDIGAWWTFIKTFFERIFSEHDYVRSSVKVYRDYSRFTDPIAKIAFTLTQLWTRRVYSRPEKFADIIEDSDHNVRVDACKKLLDKIKKLKDKLESM